MRRSSSFGTIAASIAAIALGSAAASAADMAPRYTKAPPALPPPCTWCGWYAGVNVGGAWGTNTNDGFSGNPATNVFFANNEFPTSLATNPAGAIGGGQIGYNWEFPSRWLLGVEADIQGSSYKGTATATPVPTGGFVPFITSVEQHNHWFGTLRGRVGFEASPNLLLYGTGGLAYGQTEASFSAIATGFTLANCPTNFTCTVGSSTSTRAGWTAGAGFEWMFAPQWSVKTEYLYMDLGRQSATAIPTPSGVSTPAFNFTASAPFRENIVRVGINYHFGGGPIYAKY